MKLKFFAMLPLGLFFLGATSTETNASDLMIEDEEHVDNYDSTEDSFEEISHRNTGKMTKEEKNRLKEIKKNEKKRKKSLEDANSSYENESDEATESENGDKKPCLWARFKNKIHRNKNTSDDKNNQKSSSKEKVKKTNKDKKTVKSKEENKKPGFRARIRKTFSRSKDSNKK